MRVRVWVQWVGETRGPWAKLRARKKVSVHSCSTSLGWVAPPYACVRLSDTCSRYAAGMQTNGLLNFLPIPITPTDP